ncbi:hypothetical protein CPT06_12520 [Bacillus vallismortis]|nr:hypothetical protein CPT06_12520 [Bacillus vallismortis]
MFLLHFLMSGVTWIDKDCFGFGGSINKKILQTFISRKKDFFKCYPLYSETGRKIKNKKMKSKINDLNHYAIYLE